MDGQQSWYRQALKLRGAVVADVGANVGALSQFFFDAVGPKGKVISIEPVPDNIKAIEKRIRKAGSGARKRWLLKKCAASARLGRVKFRVMRAAWGTNGMVATDDKGKLIDVACHPLVELAPDATVVKLDIEGHEYEVLPHALETMPAVHSWALELHCVAGHPLERTLKSLADRGFALYAAGRRRDDPDGAWVSAPIAPTLTWAQVPGTRTQHDGIPGMFKMLHVLALRRD